MSFALWSRRPARLLVAPCSFKGSLGPVQAARAIADGLGEAMPGAELELCPLADGGEGTLEVLLELLGAERREARVSDPLGRPVNAAWGWLAEERTALIESAQAAGLPLLDARERDPLRCSTFGVGQLVRAALDAGARRVFIGLGGTGTVDGGTGLLQALGVSLKAADGRDLDGCGAALEQLCALDGALADPRLRETELIALCDVASPLLGPRGTRLYMAQKGATPALSDRLEAGLYRLAAAAAAAGRDVRGEPGGGAAGGLGAALMWLGASYESGSGFVFERVGLAERVGRCDLVIGGEGRVDDQSLEGKPLGELARLARSHGRPFLALCGSRADELRRVHEAGVSAVMGIVPGPASEAEAMRCAGANLSAAARQLGRLLAALQRSD
jgi:glycerate 2-kinase